MKTLLIIMIVLNGIAAIFWAIFGLITWSDGGYILQLLAFVHLGFSYFFKWASDKPNGIFS